VAQSLVTSQRLFDRGDCSGDDEDPDAEQHGTEPALLCATGDRIADNTDDGGARVASPVELTLCRCQENRDTDDSRDGRGTRQLDAGNDAIGPGKFTVVYEATSDAEREHVRDC